MDTRKVSKCSTPSQIRASKQEDFIHSTFNSDSSIQLRHVFETPPSRMQRVRNPFEPVMHDKLHTHFMSPSIFKMRTPKPDESLKWNIDDISHIKPADIDLASIEQYDAQDQDSILESIAQSRIDKYFSMKEIVPSPFAQAINQSPLIKEGAVTPLPIKVTKTDNTAQTILSFPPILPEEVEKVLRPYFSYTDDQQGGETHRNSSLYRKLFDIEETESEQSSPAKSIDSNISDIQFSSPFGRFEKMARNFGTPLNQDVLKECNLSPISLSPMTKEDISPVRFTFSSHMSVDETSFVVPEAELTTNYCSAMDSTKSNQQDLLSDSTTNWDLEYKQMSSPVDSLSSNCSINEMNVSNSNTPRYRKIKSSRKKLSDSFENQVQAKTIKSNDTLKEVHSSITDLGYQTGSVHEEQSWTNPHLFASTPTKQKIVN